MAYYSLTTRLAPPCPHCGHLIVERRGPRRSCAGAAFRFSYKGTVRNAKVIDYSAGGMRIECAAALPVDSIFVVNVDALGLGGAVRVVWSRGLGGSRVAMGLELLDDSEARISSYES